MQRLLPYQVKLLDLDSSDLEPTEVLIGTLGSQSQLQLALKLLKELPDHTYRSDVITFTQAVKACDSSNLWQEPLWILHWMDMAAVNANEVTLGALLRTQSLSFKAGSHGSQAWSRAISSMASMACRSLEVNAIMFNTILGSGEVWSQSVNLMEKMKSLLRPNSFVCSALLSCCVQAAQWPHALSLWCDVCGPKKARKLDRLKPDVIMYNSIIAACQHCSAASWALELIEDMPKKALTPSTSSYNAVLAACESSTMWEECLSILHKMRQHGPFPDLISYSSCVRACARAEQSNLVRQLFTQMRQLQLQLDAWHL